MEHTTCDGHIADYARSAAYEKALTSSEIIKAVTHFRHFRDKKYRKTWLSRARACDKIGRARLSVGRVADAYCGRRIVFVGPELAGNGLAVPEAAVSLARDLNALGCTVDLVTRVLPEFLPAELLEVAGDVRFVRPLQTYSSAIEDDAPTVIAFWLPLSIQLCGAGIRHVCIWDARSSRLVDGDAVSGLDAALIAHLAPLPDVVLGASKLPSSGRKVFPPDAATLSDLVEAAYPPPPHFPQLPTVSACMIAKDEEGMIEGCFQSLVSCVDQVVLNDTGSTDLTFEIAEAYGAEVIRTEWKDDFSVARNASLEMAKCDWILAIDADERIAEGSQVKLREAALSEMDAHLVTVANRVDASVKTVPVLRLFRNRPYHRFVGAIHEQVAPSIKGRVGVAQVVLDHIGYGKAVSQVKLKRGRNVALLLKELGRVKSPQDPTYPYLAYQAGGELLQSGSPIEALPLLRQAVELSASDAIYRPSALLSLCQALIRLGRISEAELCAINALETYPGFLDIAEVVASALLDHNEPERAEDILNKALASPPSPIVRKTDGADTYLLSTLRARISLGLGDADSALTYIQNALTQNPDYGDAQRLLALNWPSRVRDCLRSVGATTVLPAAQILMVRNMIEAAHEAAAAIGDHSTLGLISIVIKDFAAAREHYAKSRDPRDKDKAAILERCALQSDSRGDARGDTYETPISPLAAKVLAGQPVNSGEVDDSLRVLEFLLDIGQKGVFATAVGCLSGFQAGEILAGSLLYRKGLMDDARDFLERRQYDAPECLKMLGDIEYLTKRYEKAAYYYRELSGPRQLSPTESFRLADSLLRLGDIKAVADVVREARTLYPEDGKLEKLAEILQRSPLFKNIAIE